VRLVYAYDSVVVINLKFLSQKGEFSL
jgi:hypothetical protein